MKERERVGGIDRGLRYGQGHLLWVKLHYQLIFDI